MTEGFANPAFSCCEEVQGDFGSEAGATAAESA
jgi:hypothetical protein